MVLTEYECETVSAFPVVRVAVKAQYMSIGTSLGSVAYSLVCYRKSMALMFLDQGDIFWRDTLAHFVWRLLEVGPRVVALGAFASLFPWSIGGLFILRGLIMVVWILLISKEDHVENGYVEVWRFWDGSKENCSWWFWSTVQEQELGLLGWIRSHSEKEN